MNIVTNDRWTIRHFRGFDAAYACIIRLNGKDVITCQQSGRGGSNLYQPMSEYTHEIIERFRSMAKAWGTDNGVPTDRLIEIEDDWVLFTHGDGGALPARDFLRMRCLGEAK